MPTYEYRCRNCGRHLEVVQSFSDPSLTICDECGGELRKVFAAPAIAFKGSGFYATDSKRSSAPSDKAGPEAKPEGSGATSDKKGEPAKDSGSTPERATKES